MDESSFGVFAATALLAGFVFGYCAQRGGFCLTRALSNLVLTGDGSIARAYVLALVVAIVGTHLLALAGSYAPALGIAELPVRPFHWVANLVGGFVFGIGMILSGGCAGSSWYRLGEGALGAWIVLFGFALGATATNVGVLAPVRKTLQEHELLAGDQPATLYHLLGVGPWPVIAGVVVLAALWLARGAAEPEHGKWKWPLTGSVMGLVIALGWYLSSYGGSPTGLTFAANTGHLLTYPLVGFPNRVTWSMFVLVGLPFGSALAAWQTRQFRWKAPPGFTSVQLFAGGLTMGVGALIAEGCNITQGLTNAATLALGSLTAFGAMLAGGWAALWMLFLRKS
ncbi:MAG TPA: YeeE/YedE family protein [Methylomirabilota bacterium]|nr:YeeE/YedE family protein [Methylomirabilota bacterium]HEV8699701.1 YeeE/YedE family protein [Candidatus Polarisedimenticolia bacterium]